jgi:hypothetical protein
MQAVRDIECKECQRHHAEPHHAERGKIRPQRSAQHHHEAEQAGEDLTAERFGDAQLIERHEEPEQPRHSILRLPRDLTEFDDRRYEQGLADPQVDFGQIHGRSVMPEGSPLPVPIRSISLQPHHVAGLRPWSDDE